MLMRNNFASFDLRKVGHGAPGERRMVGSFELGAPDPTYAKKIKIRNLAIFQAKILVSVLGNENH
jgi:hypothetical protein